MSNATGRERPNRIHGAGDEELTGDIREGFHGTVGGGSQITAGFNVRSEDVFLKHGYEIVMMPVICFKIVHIDTVK